MKELAEEILQYVNEHPKPTGCMIVVYPSSDRSEIQVITSASFRDGRPGYRVSYFKNYKNYREWKVGTEITCPTDIAVVERLLCRERLPYQAIRRLVLRTFQSNDIDINTWYLCQGFSDKHRKVIDEALCMLTSIE